MPDIQDLLAKARALGEALAAHPTVKAHHAAQRAVRADAAAQKLLQDYQSQIAHIQELEATGRPVEVADKQKLKSFETQMAGQDSLKTLMRTQADYVALMAQVNGAIDGPLAALATPEKPA
ncbi:MAG: YlbF family regulator [Phycisphaerae bacterium]|nr:YlbF family regulator [Phycisphaerae bacterium]